MIEYKNENKILEIKNLVVSFTIRGKVLYPIRDVSLDLYKGETLGLAGESGSGKSVLTKTLIGMLDANGKVESGNILYNGEDIAKYKTQKDFLKIRGKKIAMIFQDPMTALNPLKKIGHQITEVIIKHFNKSKQEAFEEAVKLLERVGIYNARERFHNYPHQFSGGQKQRIVIAIAFACKPDILICDEPTTSLDVTVQKQILNLLEDLKKEFKITVIFITHDLGVIAKVSDRVAILYAGQLLEIGKVNEMFYDPKHPYTWALISSLPQLAKKGDVLYSIKGNAPSLYKKIEGEAFAPRNQYALEIDFVKESPMFKLSETHYAKTWLLDERAPKVSPPEFIKELALKYKGEF